MRLDSLWTHFFILVAMLILIAVGKIGGAWLLCLTVEAQKKRLRSGGGVPRSL